MVRAATFLPTLAALACVTATGCKDGAGIDGSDILVPYEQLGGNIVFATQRILGSAGYDLYMIPTPNTSSFGELPFVRVTDAGGDEWQPSVGYNGTGIAFVKDFEIHVITSSGRVRKISDISGTDFKDSLPAVSRNAQRVAWVREDTDRPIGNSGFSETYIMIANFDGTEQRKVEPRDGTVQDAPVFDPARDATRLAWSEFRPDTFIAGSGPTEYGVRVFDFRSNTGTYVCRAENGVTPGTNALPARGAPYRCFGQHLTWPLEDVIVLSQDLLEIYIRQANRLESTWTNVVEATQRQQTGIPQIGARGDGFFPPFPISVSYSKDNPIMVFDGVITEIDGNAPTLAFFTATTNGDSPFRIQIAGWRNDIDTTNTVNFLFSVAKPTLIPFPTND